MNFNEHKPIYLQISDSICEKILNDEYREDERIPSIRELGAMLGVNPNTVMRSFEHLKSIDIIYDKRGVGFFISPNAKCAVKKIYKEEFMNTELPAIIKKIELLDININDLTEKINKELEKQKNLKVNHT
ncbi:MAG TPA: GntR family transcriptional regulator [Clostridiales bacterium]|jgi:DNA-binding transcriptional regulator YhcF (GntR family)|nr:GntR family transcriptional regulator [Petrimonas sp.]HAC72748.1 GntR family transcriptional regulator [Porphyromonadaceae bacterium]HBC31058.1 GntR family transcriptional regulator [Clostridiales bacterium]HBU45583.1 GntR family transcriptional regulator [Porphyromonadaceae bacterium]